MKRIRLFYCVITVLLCCVLIVGCVQNKDNGSSASVGQTSVQSSTSDKNSMEKSKSVSDESSAIQKKDHKKICNTIKELAVGWMKTNEDEKNFEKVLGCIDKLDGSIINLPFHQFEKKITGMIGKPDNVSGENILFCIYDHGKEFGKYGFYISYSLNFCSFELSYSENDRSEHICIVYNEKSDEFLISDVYCQNNGRKNSDIIRTAVSESFETDKNKADFDEIMNAADKLKKDYQADEVKKVLGKPFSEDNNMLNYDFGKYRMTVNFLDKNESIPSIHSIELEYKNTDNYLLFIPYE